MKHSKDINKQKKVYYLQQLRFLPTPISGLICDDRSQTSTLDLCAALRCGASRVKVLKVCQSQRLLGSQTLQGLHTVKAIFF